MGRMGIHFSALGPQILKNWFVSLMANTFARGTGTIALPMAKAASYLISDPMHVGVQWPRREYYWYTVEYIF